MFVIQHKVTPSNEHVIGFVYNNLPSDYGWNFQLEQSRIQIGDTFGRDIIRTVHETSYDDSDLEKAVAKLVAKGAELIFVSPKDVQFPLQNIANKFPDVNFVTMTPSLQASGIPNLNSVFLRNWQCFNLIGTLAALVSDRGKGGLVVPTRNPDTNRIINAFYFGARLVNPSFSLEVYYTQNKNSYSRTRKSVQLFAESGADVVMGYLTDASYLREAVDRGLMTFSYPNSFDRIVYGDLVLTGCVVDWNNAVNEWVNRTLHGVWKSDYVAWYGAFEGGVKLTSISDIISDKDAAATFNRYDLLKKNLLPCTFLQADLERLDLIPKSVNISYGFSNGCTSTPGLIYMDYLLKGIIDHGELDETSVFTAVYVEETSGAAIALYVIVTVMNFMIIVSLIVVYAFRKRVIIAATNEYFCYSILFGSMIGYSSIYLWLGKPNDSKCLLRVWFLSVACSLIFGAIASKTYRIWRLWTNPDIKETKRSDSVIIMFIGVILCTELVLLIVLTVMAGYYEAQVTSSELDYDKYYLVCQLNNSGVIIISLLLAFDGVVVLSCGVLAYASKSVSQKYNETNSIVLSIYSIIVSVVVVILLFVNIKTQDPNRQLTFIASGVFIAITCPLLSIFLPKFKVIITEYSGGSSPSSGVSVSANSSNVSSNKMSN